MTKPKTFEATLFVSGKKIGRIVSIGAMGSRSSKLSSCQIRVRTERDLIKSMRKGLRSVVVEFDGERRSFSAKLDAISRTLGGASPTRSTPIKEWIMKFSGISKIR